MLRTAQPLIASDAAVLACFGIVVKMIVSIALTVWSSGAAKLGPVSALGETYK